MIDQEILQEPVKMTYPERQGKILRVAMEVLLFLIVLAMFPFSQDPTGDIKYLLCGWGAAILFGAWLVSVWRFGAAPIRPRILLEIFILFLTLGVLSSFFGAHIENSLAEMGRFWSFFVLYLVASQIYKTVDQARRTMLVICVAVAIASLYALIIQHFGWDPFPWRERTSDEYINLPGTFGNPNYAAHTLILAIVMAIFLATRISMIWTLAFAVLFLVYLRFTHQRAGVIALFASLTLVITAFSLRNRVRRPVKSVLITLAIVAVVGIVGVGAVMGVSKIRHGSPYPLDLSLLIRYKSYCSAASMIMTRPIFGYGPANYKIEYPRFWTPYEQKWFSQELKMNAHVHNDILEIAADQGLPSAGLYLAAIVLVISYGLLIYFSAKDSQTRKLGLAFAGMFLAFLIDGLFGFNLRVPVSAAIFFIFAGVLEGVWNEYSGSDDVKRLAFRIPSWTWKTAVIVLSLFCVLRESTVFASQVLMLRGSSEIEMQRFEKAEPYLKRAEKFTPWNWEIARQRGLAKLCQTKYDEAIGHLERARNLNPQYVMTLVLLGRAKNDLARLNITNQPDKAESALKMLDEAYSNISVALKICPGFSAAEEVVGHIAMGRALLLQQRAPDQTEKIQAEWKAAKDAFSVAVEQGAKNPSEIYRQLVQVNMALGDPKAAEESILRATQADPSDELNWPFFYSFAKSSKLYDKFREALQWRLERLQEKEPKDNDSLATAYLWVASVEYDGYNRPDTAEAAYRNAISCKPLNPATWSAYANFAQAANRQDSFKEYLLDMDKRILDKGMQSLPHVRALARAWSEGQNSLVEATAILVGMVQGTVQFPGMMLPDYDMKWAILALAKEVRSSTLPQDQAALVFLHLGIAAGAISEWKLADQVLATAMPYLSPQRQIDCAQHWANALIRLDRVNEALNLLKEAVKKIPDDYDLHLSLARAYIKNNNLPEARQEYQNILNMPKLSPHRREQIQAELGALMKRSEKPV